MIRRLEPLSWLLVAIAGWSLVCVVVALSDFGGRSKPLPNAPSLTPKLPAIPKSVARSSLGALEVYAEAYNHPLFFPDRKPAATHVPGKSGSDDHPLDVILTSVIMTPTLQLAIVQDPKTHQSLRVREGQPIGGDYSGWKLSGLSPRSATFDSDSQGQATLDLRVFDGKGGEESTRMGLTPQAVASGALGAMSPPPEPPGDANVKDDSQPDAQPDTTAPDPAQAADANAAAQAAQQQAEEIRHRIEQRRQQALSKRQANEKER